MATCKRINVYAGDTYFNRFDGRSTLMRETIYLDGKDIDEAITCLTSLKERWADKLEDLVINEVSCEYSDDDRRELVLTGYRMETDAEAEARETSEVKMKADRDAYDRKKYEDLKKKFETK